MISATLLVAFVVRFGGAAADSTASLEPACNSGDGVHTSAPSPAAWAFHAKSYFYAQVNDVSLSDTMYVRIRLGLDVDMAAIRVQFNSKSGSSHAEALSYAYSKGSGYNDLIMEMKEFTSKRKLNCKSDLRIFSTQPWKVWKVVISSSLSDMYQCSCDGVLAPTCSSTQQQCLSPCAGKASSGCGAVPAPRSIEFPSRGTFFYPWFPKTWTVGGKYTHWHPTLGYYSSSDPAVVDKHIQAFEYGKIEVAITSWWGINENHEQLILPMLLDRAAERKSNVKFAVYYEKEGYADKDSSLSTLKTEMKYLEQRYAGHPSIAHVDGKPVMFVWNTDKPSCSTVKKFNDASAGKWFVVLKVFKGSVDCTHKGGNWFQYGEVDSGELEGTGSNSITIGPGFYKATDSKPRIARDVNRWKGNVKHMVASKKSWHLVDSFNEFGEGTAVESSKEWESSSGYGKFLDALHDDGMAENSSKVFVV